MINVKISYTCLVVSHHWCHHRIYSSNDSVSYMTGLLRSNYGSLGRKLYQRLCTGILWLSSIQVVLVVHLRSPLARNNFLPVLESWVTQLFQQGVWGRRAAAMVTMGDIAGRFTSGVTARLPSAALWSACSLTVTVTLSTCGGSTGALLALKKVVLFDETFDLTRHLRFRSYFVMLAIRLRGLFRFANGTRFYLIRAYATLNWRTCSYTCPCKVARETSTPATFRAISQR